MNLSLTTPAKSLLREYAVRAARSCAWLPHKRRSGKPREIFRNSSRRFFKLERELYKLRSAEPSEDLKVLYENLRLVRTDIQDLEFGTKILSTLPAVRTLKEESIPRALVLARALLAATNNQLTESAFSFFIEAVQQIEPLRLSELRAMLAALKLILLENVVDAGFKALQEFRNSELAAQSFQIGRMVRSLRLIGDIDWKETIE